MILLSLAAGGTLAVSVGWWVYQRSFAGWEHPEASVAVAALSSEAAAATSRTIHAVRINPGPETPRVLATLPETGGLPAMVSCATCHATRKPDLTTTTSEALNEFHQGLQYRHGSLTCLSCHDAGNYDTLRRADGTAIGYPNTIQLCAQCHGPQFRDYTNGSHGGMTGHWDLTVGDRTRNTCTDCHDVHAPAYPRVQPVFPPQDRGARQQRERAVQTHESDSTHG